MDAQFEWQEEFNIGVETIDKEHQRLFKIINKLFRMKEEEKNSQWACQEGIKFFKGHAVKHFAEEEAYMTSIHYEGLEQHRRIHKGFRENTLPALEQELEQSGYSQSTVDHFLGVCAGWLIGHTLTEDQAITGKKIRKWENLLPGEELAAMKKVIIQLVFDMFHLESQMISDAYGGEKFGRGVYYRMVYGAGSEDQKQEIILVFEERLLIKTVGKAMGIQTNRLESKLIHATRYTAQQFVGRILEHFPTTEDYKLKEENLLTYEEFRKIIENEKLQVSLLFNTGAGYFSYCVIAPHLLENGVGTPIEKENALTEVEEYLMKREEQEVSNQKPKILVVDDSLTIREGMRKLLEEDYEVAAAESGVAAIRTITLNQPDLILLDYEMPVCDGRQTLEMLRSEKAFEEIPVIFLTGRRDPESMIKVMPLKPAGYLIKSSKPAEIKKEIDTFFEKKKAKK
ncbi:MAG: response regulator [Lachnospiraceae bacterium]|nr:response regulator [Lachnospiraceae bacterium]